MSYIARPYEGWNHETGRPAPPSLAAIPNPCVVIHEAPTGEDITTTFRRAALLAGWTPGLVLEEMPGVRFGTIPGELPRG